KPPGYRHSCRVRYERTFVLPLLSMNLCYLLYGFRLLQKTKDTISSDVRGYSELSMTFSLSPVIRTIWSKGRPSSIIFRAISLFLFLITSSLDLSCAGSRDEDGSCNWSI